MALIVDDILGVVNGLLRRIVKVRKGSTQRMLLSSETADDARGAGTRRGGKPGGGYRTGEDLEWPKTVSIFDNIVLAPLKFVRWAVNKVRRQADSEIANECGSMDRSACRTRRGED